MQRLFFHTIFIFLLTLESPSFAKELRNNSIFTYFGPATSTSLINIIKARIPEFTPFYLSTVGVSYVLTQNESAALEAEMLITKHYERADLFSFGTLVVFRLLTLPWSQSIPGSFGVGGGLSYSTDLLPVESVALGRTSKLLFHLILEYEFALGQSSPWTAFIRDHHRSGVYGVFDNIVGGSDFLCLGVRYRL